MSSVRHPQHSPRMKGADCSRIAKRHPSRKPTLELGFSASKLTQIGPRLIPGAEPTPTETSLMARIASLEKEVTTLKTAGRHEDLLHRETRSLLQGTPEFPKVAPKLMREKNRLRDQLHASQKWATLLLKDINETPLRHPSEMIKKLLTIGHEFDKLLITDVIEISCFSSLMGHSEDLDSLLTDLFDRNLTTRPEELSGVFPDLASYHIVQALVGTALRSWVFESEFTIHHFAQTEYLLRLHDALQNICGPDMLHHLDRACHETIIRDPVFAGDGVKGIVNQLENRFREAFEPVFKSEQGRGKLDSSLRNVIHAAVMLRAEMLVDENNYELLWPEAGSAFSRDEMETSRDICNSASAIVRLPLLPGFKMIPKGKAKIDYTGLTVAATGNAGAKCVAKALVC